MRFLFTILCIIPFSLSAAFLSLSTDILGLANNNGSFSGGIAANFKVDKDLRLEIGYIEHQQEKENQTIDYISTGATNLTGVTADTSARLSMGFISIYYDTRLEEKFAPYIGLGLGFGTIEYTLENLEHTGVITFPKIEESEENLIVKLSFGLRYTFNKNLEAFTQYDTFKSAFLDEVNSKGLLSDSQFNLGFRMRF